jgi:transposase
MGQAIAVRRDYTSGKLRRLAQRTKNAAQTCRLLAIAAVFDGASREEAAKIGGMDRQTLRDWVIRFNEQGPDGLINIPSPGAPAKLDETHKAFLARIVEDGPIPAIHGVVRWRACDLIMQLHEEFGLSVSDDTIYRALKDLGFSHVSARPKAYKQDTEAMDAFKKTSPDAWRKRARSSQRQNWLSNRVFKSFDDIVDHCCFAWNTLIDQPWKIMSIARRDWVIAGQSL